MPPIVRDAALGSARVGRYPERMTGPARPEPAPATPHPVLAYLRPVPADADLDLAVQRLAIDAACQGEGLLEVAAFEEADGTSSTAFVALTLAAGDQPGVEVIAASAEVFGDRARDRARRLLQLAAIGVPVRLADGRRPAGALLDAWEDRGDEERRRERARDGMRRRALRGEVLGRAPYGYRVVGRRLAPAPAEAEVVQGVFSRYLDDGEGVRLIAKRLNADGLHTRSGRPWTAGAVRNLLRNPVYTGLYRRLGIAVPRAHDALIPEARFAEVQRRMEQRRTAPAEQERIAYLLSGIVRCGYCGSPMIGARRPSEAAAGVEYALYRCASATNEGRCAYHTRRAEALEAAVREELVRATRGSPVAARPVEAAGGEARMAALGRALDRMLERRAAGEWTDAELVRHAAANVLEQLDIERSAEQGADEVPPEEARKRLLGEWENLEFAERRALLRRVVAEVVVTDEGVRVTRRR